MKDIKGKIIKKGDDVLIIENNGKVPASVIGIGTTKVKLQLREGTIVVKQDEVKLQKISAMGLQNNRKTDTLVEEMFKGTQPKLASDMTPGVELNTLRLFGVGFDSKHPAMRIDENQRKYNTYGKVYRLLKEAFDITSDDDDLGDVAEAISKIASYLDKKMSK